MIKGYIYQNLELNAYLVTITKATIVFQEYSLVPFLAILFSIDDFIGNFFHNVNDVFIHSSLWPDLPKLGLIYPLTRSILYLYLHIHP